MTFEEKEKEYLDKNEGGEQFIEEATKQIKAIAKCKAMGNMKELIRQHEKLDNIIHSYTTVAGLTTEEK